MRKTILVNIKLLIFLALLPVMLTGCLKTDGTLKIKGKITDESTNQGIPWKNIIVQGVLYNNNKSEPVEVGQFSTDSTGCFTFTVNKVKGAYDYNFCFIGNPDYPVTIHPVTLLYLQANAKYLSFSLSKLVDLTIKIRRKSKVPACDTLRMIWESNEVFGLSLYPYKIYNYGEPSDPVGLTSGSDLMWVGGKVNSTVSTKVFADKKTEINWELFRYGRRKHFTDTITCRRNFENTVYFAY